MNLTLAFFYFAAAFVLAYLAPVPHTTTIAVDNSLVRTRLVAQLNAHRHEFGLPPLGLDAIAQKAAQLQADDMQVNNALRHLDSGGRSPLVRYSDLGGRAEAYGENVAYYSDPIAEPTQQWNVVVKLDGLMMAEKPPQDGHRENILSPNYDAVGIGIAVGTHGIFIAEDFVGGRQIAAH